MSDVPNIDREHIQAWLSAPRYERYLSVSNGDDAIALDLYLWNIGLAQAVLKDISFFEIALRNAYDRAISSSWSGTGHWLFDNASPVRRPILRTNKRGQINDANRLNRNTIDHLRDGLREGATPDDVISNLPLGFWAHRTDRSHERDLWIPSIHKAWPKGAFRTDINGQIANINRIRNRAAHHEHLFAPAERNCLTLQSCRDAVSLFAQLESVACSYVYGTGSMPCSVDRYLNENPAPCDISI